MRHFYTLLLGAIITIGLGSCEPEKPRTLDSGAMLYVNINKTTRAMNIETRATLPVIENDPQRIFTPLEIVEDAGYFMMNTEDGLIDSPLAILEVQKDFENARIKMWGQQIIKEDGTLNTYFMNARNVRICGRNTGGKTDPVIAYIPNATMEQAWAEIQTAYKAGDYDKVYAIFERTYTAIPCTTMQWEALREKGEQ